MTMTNRQPVTEAGRALLRLLESDASRPFLRSVMVENIRVAFRLREQAPLLHEPEPQSIEAYRQRKQRGAEILAWIHERYGPDGRRRKARR